IDLAPAHNEASPLMILFIGTMAGGGTVEEWVSVNTEMVFATHNFTRFNNVTSVSWAQSDILGGEHQFAKIVLGDPLPLPEPAPILLFGLGLAALALRRRAGKQVRF